VIVAQRMGWVYWSHLDTSVYIAVYCPTGCRHNCLTLTCNCCTAYGLGLLMTFVALGVMGRGQPALLYIVPLTLGTTVLVGWLRKELHQLWTGQPAVVRLVGSTLTNVRQIPSSSLPSPSLPPIHFLLSPFVVVGPSFFSPLSILPLISIFASLPLEVGALNPARGSGAEPQRKSNLVHFSIEI